MNKEDFNKQYAALTPRPGTMLARVERALTVVAPKFMMRREQTRQTFARMRATGAYPNRGRENARWGDTGETLVRQQERRQLMWNALDLVDNSGLAESITGKFADYVYGLLRYQSRTGDPSFNNQYEAIMRERCGSMLDLTGRHSLRTMMRLAMRGAIVKGGMGYAFVRPYEDDPLLYLEAFEYDRIGGLYNVQVTPNFADGFWLDPYTKRPYAVDLYERKRFGGMYYRQQTLDIYDGLGRQQFLHFYNPKDADAYKGETAFKTVIDLVHYVDDMRKLELQALQFAATQSIIYYTKNGVVPAQNVLEATDPVTGLKKVLYNVTGNTVSGMEIGESAQMFEHERPSPNVIAAWTNAINEICIAAGLPMTFVNGQGGANGPGVRFEGAQADRAIATWWELGLETMLYPIGIAVLGNAIACGDAPYHPRWREGVWIGPKKLSIDAGYDSAAMLNELAAGVRTKSEIIGDDARDSDQVRESNIADAKSEIDLAMELSDYYKKKGKDVPWQIVASYLSAHNNSASGIQAAAPDPKDVGATSDGVDMPSDIGAQVRKLQADVIEIRSGNATVKAAFFGDVRYGDLPEDLRAEIKRFVPDVTAAVKIPRYGMVVSELLPKADPANLEAARIKAQKTTRADASDNVNGTRDSKYVLLLNQTVVDGHHFLANAEHGKVTTSLNVLDLTPARFQ